MLRISARPLLRLGDAARVASVVPVRWVSANEESAQHTLEVRRKIKVKKDQALLGGGLKRIDAQHKKVRDELEFGLFLCFSFGCNLMLHLLMIRTKFLNLILLRSVFYLKDFKL